MKPIIWPYKIASQGAKALAEVLECKRVYPEGNYRPRPNHLIINWGNSQRPIWDGVPHVILNQPFAVQGATNKIICLQVLDDAGVMVPEFSQQMSDTVDLFHDGRSRIYCRTKLNGHSGDGIVIATRPEELVPAPLYTVGVGKRTEYRVHIFRGEVLDFAQKRRMSGERLAEEGIEVDWSIRSHDKGWVYSREDVVLPSELGEIAVRAISALGLDFGAVDCYLTAKGVAGVFEVNTAPGLEGTTLERYAEAIRRLL